MHSIDCTTWASRHSGPEELRVVETNDITSLSIPVSCLITGKDVDFHHRVYMCEQRCFSEGQSAIFLGAGQVTFPGYRG